MTRDEIDEGIRKDAGDLAILKRDRKCLVAQAARFQEQLALADAALGRITGATCDVPKAAFTRTDWPTFDSIASLCDEREAIDGRIQTLSERLATAGVTL